MSSIVKLYQANGSFCMYYFQSSVDACNLPQRILTD